MSAEPSAFARLGGFSSTGIATVLLRGTVPGLLVLMTALAGTCLRSHAESLSVF